MPPAAPEEVAPKEVKDIIRSLREIYYNVLLSSTRPRTFELDTVNQFHTPRTAIEPPRL